MAKQPTGIFPADEWTLARAQTPTGTHHVRFRNHLPKAKDRKKFPMVIIVRWKFPLDVSTGRPMQQILSLMDEFEDRLIKASDAERDWGACAVVLTVGDIREWRIFTPDEKTFIAGFNNALKGFGPYPVTFQALQDPDWNALREFQPGGARSGV